MARFQLHLGLRFSSPFSQRDSVFVDKDVQSDNEMESGSECDDDAILTSPILPVTHRGSRDRTSRRCHHISRLALAATAFRRSIAMCSLGGRDDGIGKYMHIGCPTDVQHVSHVTFDRFDGFLGLPEDLQPEIPSKVPSASISVFGVSAESMKCSHDSRGNSVPTILLSMQRYLYSQGGLKTEGIFRINGDNGQEMLAREQLNKGIVPYRVDLHCLAGLIKAWFRELPSGVLDSLTPEQVMHCNRKGEFSQLISLLPPTEAALLDWAINLMADVVEHERHNKMNARNIAMVFAPNMAQMSDPLIALIHAVQLMNFLDALITKTLHGREQAAAEALQLHSSFRHRFLNTTQFLDIPLLGMGSDSDTDESFKSFEMGGELEVESDFLSGRSSPSRCDSDEYGKIGHGNSVTDSVISGEYSRALKCGYPCNPPVF